MAAVDGARYRKHEAAYVGTGEALFALVFKNLLLTIVTLGVYLPWARTERRQFIWQNVEFDGHRFRYHGTGREMLIGYLKVGAAYVVLFGVPAALARVDPKLGAIAKAVGFFVLLVLLPLAIYGSRSYVLGRTTLRGIRFGLVQGAGGYLKIFLVGVLLTICTLGIYGPIMNNNLRRYMTEHVRYGSAAFGYDGDNRIAFHIAVKGFILSVLTLGLYYPWYLAEMARFHVEHTYIRGARGKLALTGTDVFWLLAVSIPGTVLSLGIAFPWITTHVMKTVLSRLSVEGVLDYGTIGNRAASGDAATDGLASALDVGLEV
ncbi:MAG TPA: DUF898 family protein [Polyangiaceae bacterium]|nr:DUF898 family protein [Polyangiaceae bacterium]